MRSACLALLLLATPLAAAGPEQVHLGLPTEDPSTTRSVLWLDATPEAEPTVTLTGPDGVARAVRGELVGGPSAGFAYEARFADLAPGASYEYKVGDKAFSFATPATALGFTFVALGDMGTTAQAAATVRAIQGIQPAFILHSGDISYAAGDPLEWKKWFDLVEPVAATTPWITALGNHEADVEGAGVPVVDAPVIDPAEQAFYKQRFGLPGNEVWYSFDWQGAHFVALDTFSELALPPDELAWLEIDLARHADASWTIVFLHEPPYSSNAHGSSTRLQQALVPLIERHHVDLVIAAHDHAYERFGQLLGGTPVTAATATFEKGAAPLYVVSGGAGESIYDQWRTPLVAGSVAHSSSYHVTRVHVTADRIEGAYVATDGTPFSDAFTIERRPPVAPGEVPAAEERAAPMAGLAVALAAVAAIAVFRFRPR